MHRRYVLGCLILLCLPAYGQVPAEARQYQRLLIGAARNELGLNAPIAMFAAQIHQESAWRPGARSQAGAMGLGQFMPSTAAWMPSLGMEKGDPHNPLWAIQALVKYDAWLYDRAYPYETVCDRWALVLMGYNGGEKWRQRRQAASWAPGSYKVTAYINPGISASNQRENQTYAPRILLDLQPRYADWGPTVDCEGLLR